MSLHHCLREIIAQAKPLLADVTEAEWRAKETPKRWSKLQVLGHLADSAYNNHQRFLRGPDQDNYIFQGYTQDTWVRRNAYQDRPVQDVLQLWEVTNLHLAYLLEQLTEEELERTHDRHNFLDVGMIPFAFTAPANLRYLIWDYLYHLEHHLVQLVPRYERMAGPLQPV